MLLKAASLLFHPTLCLRQGLLSRYPAKSCNHLAQGLSSTWLRDWTQQGAEKLWMPHLWKGSKLGCTGLWASWPSGRCPCPWQGAWIRWPLEVPSNPNHSMILKTAAFYRGPWVLPWYTWWQPSPWASPQELKGAKHVVERDKYNCCGGRRPATSYLLQ